MANFRATLDDLARLARRAKCLDDVNGVIGDVSKALGKLSRAMRKLDHPPLETYSKLSIMPDRSIRFYVGTGIFYDSKPGHDSEVMIRVVEGLYRGHTTLSKLNSDRDPTWGRLIEPSETDEATS